MLHPHQEIVNGHEFWMLPVEGGRFLMGSAEDDVDAYPNERPQHEVLESSFYLGKYPVTQALWRAVVQAESVRVTQSHPDTSLDPSPSNFQGDDLPVEQVSWDDAQVFIQKLNELTESTRLPGYVYRLPTEAEWEYAARLPAEASKAGAGKFHAEGYKYSGSDRLKDVGWFEDNSGRETKPVGLKSPNQLGLYDMSGNVWEWCEDWFGDSEYFEECKQKGIVVNPIGPEKGAYRVGRGGGWYAGAQVCRAAYRGHWHPDYGFLYIGFRLALSLQ